MFKADKDSKSAFRTEKTIKSHDVNSVEFHITIDGLELTDSHTAKILSVFHTSESQANVNCEIVEGKIIYKPDTKLISRHEHVTNYVYVYKDNQSLDVREFIYVVDLSKIDETSLEVKEVYDQSYADLLADFEQALEDYKDNLPQADSVRAEIDVILNQFSVDSQAKLSQYDADAQQAIADNQTAFDLAETGRQDSYNQAESKRNQLSNQAIVDWTQDVDALLEAVEGNESARVNAESTRETSETDRVSSESIRKTNETTRISNENARKSAEVIRLASEADRVSAENVRAEFYEGFDGRLGGLESDRVVIRNLVTNGDFSKGFDGWRVRGDVQNIGGRAKLVRLTGNPLASLSYEDKTIFASRNDVYYMSVQGELVNMLSGADGVMINDTVNVLPVWVLQLQPNGVISNSSIIFNLSSNNSPYVYANTVEGSEYFIDHIIIVNLTEEFGAGNEPTKAEMDELIKITGYFEEFTLTQKQLLNWQLKLMRQNRNALIALGGTII